MSRLEYIVEDTGGARIDKWVSERNCGISRSMLQKLMVEQKITVNGKFAAKSYLVKEGDFIEIDVPEPVELDVVPENIPVEIVYQDEH
ncbi:MAG: RNA pseudouridine synthase, partial [Oscillospiraceae bacterium]|nr:RNA pseudouridine synthase [Oscillospiraceae bacterium]